MDTQVTHTTTTEQLEELATHILAKMDSKPSINTLRLANGLGLRLIPVAGALDEGRIEWLEATLAEEREKPTVLAMHHPPLITAIPSFDAIGLAPEWRQALAEVLARHPQVARGVVGGSCWSGERARVPHRTG